MAQPGLVLQEWEKKVIKLVVNQKKLLELILKLCRHSLAPSAVVISRTFAEAVSATILSRSDKVPSRTKAVATMLENRTRKTDA